MIILILLVLIIIIISLLSYFLYKCNTKPDIYLIPPSRTHPDSYGEPIINLLSKYGNIIKVDWPRRFF